MCRWYDDLTRTTSISSAAALGGGLSAHGALGALTQVRKILTLGGSPTAVGTLFGAVLLVLIVTTMQIVQLPPGIQDVVEGIVIIAVLSLASGAALRRATLGPPVRPRE